MESLPLDARPVPQGPRAYRNRLRRLGPVLGLLPPGALAALSWLLLRDNTGTARGLLSFLLAVLAAPGLLVAGVPLSGSPADQPLAVVGSVALWVLLGVLAARRATRLPVASWRDFWREYLWLACGVWLGVLGALMAVNLLLGRALV